MNTNETINLSDYERPAFLIEKTYLSFHIEKSQTIVNAKLDVKKNSQVNNLILNGSDLELLEVKINTELLNSTQYIVSKDSLEIKNVPDHFVLETKVKIDPVNNLSCEGLYQSGSIFCTQNEPEGFRRITYFLDRPDVMSVFTTHIKAKKADFPLLLANGNKAKLEDAGDGYHEITWNDPHPKPAYLFAIVAGDLALVKDTFTTMSGKVVDLEIYVDHGNENKCKHAMDSLKNSMKWDEDRFGLEYDLDLYMIVAVDSFNMGAMENKGLNIFNSAYVLGNEQSATDNAFQGIEAVIGHEYFHNWTGNRVTCRDWFQLTLKEGLTVFRDQEFSSDMLSRNVKRIQDVNTLRAHQFSEDKGPFSHPIKPKSYIEINNFYTSTIYEKGAEVIRMVHTLIGEEKFRKGMDIYFNRFDGMAVTTEDFIQSMSEASGLSLDHFKVWYDQNGTPDVYIDKKYIADSKRLEITIKHSTKLNNPNYDSLFFPFDIGLISSEGDKYAGNTNLIVDSKEKIFIFENVDFDPILSLNRQFSAPVNVHFNFSDQDLLTLAQYDDDGFCRFDAFRTLVFRMLKNMIDNSEYNISESFFTCLRGILNDKSLEDSYKSLFFELPSQQEVNEYLDQFDIEGVYTSLNLLKKQIASKLESDLINQFEKLKVLPYSLSAESMGARQLKNLCLSYLCCHDDKYTMKAKEQFQAASNMTDEISSLKCLYLYSSNADVFMHSFYEKWKGTTLVMQMWIGMQAGNSKITLKQMDALESLPEFDPKVPNLLRSLYGSFKANTYAFNNTDGTGYKYICEKIAQIDKYNPSVAARLAKSFNHVNYLDAKLKKLMRDNLELLLSKNLSADTYEVIKTTLA